VTDSSVDPSWCIRGSQMFCSLIKPGSCAPCLSTVTIIAIKTKLLMQLHVSILRIKQNVLCHTSYIRTVIQHSKLSAEMTESNDMEPRNLLNNVSMESKLSDAVDYIANTITTIYPTY
jgi:hypothetical protein